MRLFSIVALALLSVLQATPAAPSGPPVRLGVHPTHQTVVAGVSEVEARLHYVRAMRGEV